MCLLLFFFNEHSNERISVFLFLFFSPLSLPFWTCFTQHLRCAYSNHSLLPSVLQGPSALRLEGVCRCVIIPHLVPCTPELLLICCIAICCMETKAEKPCRSEGVVLSASLLWNLTNRHYIFLPQSWHTGDGFLIQDRKIPPCQTLLNS